MNAAPRILFVPVSGPAGVGEYYESLALAGGIRSAWPDADVRFVINRDARYAHSVPYPVTQVRGSPTVATEEVVPVIDAFKPQLVIFVAAGRVKQFRAAREVGARVVYVSQRPNTRSRGFRLRRMRYLDQHWIAQSRLQGGQLNWLEKLKLRLAPNLHIAFFDGLHESIDEKAVRRLQSAYGLEAGHYIVVSPGGGGRFGAVSGSEVFALAARALAARTSYTVVLVVGPNANPVIGNQDKNFAIMTSLPNGQLMGLMRDARFAITNGGTLMVQTLMQGTPCMAVPIAGDQSQRIAPYAARGMVVAQQLNPGAMVDSAVDVLQDESCMNKMRHSIADAGLTNGVPTALREIASLLGLSAEQAAH